MEIVRLIEIALFETEECYVEHGRTVHRFLSKIQTSRDNTGRKLLSRNSVYHNPQISSSLCLSTSWRLDFPLFYRYSRMTLFFSEVPVR